VVSDGWADNPIVASVVPCQLPMKETTRLRPVARRISRCAASLASEPERPNQAFFSKSPGTSETSFSARSTAGRLIPETRPPNIDRSSCRAIAFLTDSSL
jgi:hypothetical protein